MEAALATRVALLEAASALLDAGGPEAVTLREVGARAGVSRTAPYRHFADKESLLTELATDAWRVFGDDLERVMADSAGYPSDVLRGALVALVTTGRNRPHLYRLMFSTPTADPSALVRAAERTQDWFLDIVANVVGTAESRRYGALLMTSAHGMIGLEHSGHLGTDKWAFRPEDLIALLVGLLPLER